MDRIVPQPKAECKHDAIGTKVVPLILDVSLVLHYAMAISTSGLGG